MKWFHYSETQSGYRRTDFLVPAISLEAFKEAAEESGDWLDNAIVCEEEFDGTDTVGSSMDYGEPDPSEADEATVAHWTHPFAQLKQQINLAATASDGSGSPFEQLFNQGRDPDTEFADEISHYLVDVQGDEEFERSTWFVDGHHAAQQHELSMNPNVGEFVD